MVGGRTLRLHEFFQALEGDIAGAAGRQDPKEAAGVAREPGLLSEREEQRFAGGPDADDDEIADAEDEEAALEDDAQVGGVGAAGEGGGGKGVDGGRAAPGEEPGARHGEHVGEGSGREGGGGEAAHDEDGGCLEGDLEGVGKDDGDGGFELEEKLPREGEGAVEMRGTIGGSMGGVSAGGGCRRRAFREEGRMFVGRCF